MTITISAEDPRTIRALEIAATAGQWLKCKIVDGAKAYGVPSQRSRDRYYLVTCSSCDCPDAKRHANQACKHQLAVRLHCELVKAEQARQTARTGVATASACYDDIFKRFEGE
jgi:hypothetical protein